MTRVTDHALLRYLERSSGIDVEALRGSLTSRLERASVAAAQLGIENYAVRLDGVQFIIRAERVTTVLKPVSDAGRFHALAMRDSD